MSTQSETLERSWYLTGEAFQHERRTLFAHSWLMLGRAAILQDAGDFLALNSAGWPIVVIRGDDGKLRAFRNTCRHQAMIVVDQATGRIADTLRCRYHGWTYDTRGRFAGAPAQYAPADAGATANHLIEIDLAEWQGLLFGRVAPGAGSFEPVASGADWPFAPAPALAFHSEITTDLACNWKTLVEHIVATTEARSGRERSVRWQWPTLVRESGPGERIVHQIVPRTFSRSRVITHCFFSANADVAARLAAVKAELDADRAQCEKVQAGLARGEVLTNAVTGSALDRFRTAVAAAHAAEPIADPLDRKAPAT